MDVTHRFVPPRSRARKVLHIRAGAVSDNIGRYRSP